MPFLSSRGWRCALFAFFLLRELECATAEFSDITLHRDARTVKTNLSVSKNDPRALGCERTWGCICSDADAPNARSCPYHAAEALVDHLIDIFVDAVFADGCPPFPGSPGKPSVSSNYGAADH